jgi:hypothetical protein
MNLMLPRAYERLINPLSRPTATRRKPVLADPRKTGRTRPEPPINNQKLDLCEAQILGGNAGAWDGVW